MGSLLFLQFLAQINQEIAATDKVKSGKWRIFDYILFGKNQHVADVFVDAISAAVCVG